MKIKRPRLPVALLLLAILAITYIRIRLLTIPLERDEGEFAYGGQLMLQGIPPYKFFYNMKFPGIYAAYALCMAVFGQSAAGVHLGLLAVNLLCILLLYRVALRFLDLPSAVAAAVTYALLSTSPAVLGLAAHATHFVVAAALAGLLLLLRGQDSKRPALFFCGGLAMGLAGLMKQPGIMFGLFGICWLAARGIQEKSQWQLHLRRIALYAIGGATPLVLAALMLWQAGVWKRFWFWAVVYARVHATEYPMSAGWEQLKDYFSSVPMAADLFWMAAGLGLVSLIGAGGDRRKKIWLAVFSVFSAAAVSGSYYFSPHYFVLLLPALSLLIGQLFNVALRWLRMKSSNRWLAALPAGVFVLMLGLVMFYNRGIFFVLSPVEVCKEIYGVNPFLECQQIGRYLREHSAPDSRIAVLGSEPELFFAAHRRSATGYIYTYDFYEPQPYAAEMQQEMISEIERARPEYLVWVKIPTSWDARLDFGRVSGTPVMAWAPQFARSHYEPAGVVVVKAQSEYFWGNDVAKHLRPGDPYIAIFKRK